MFEVMLSSQTLEFFEKSSEQFETDIVETVEINLWDESENGLHFFLYLKK